MRWRHLNCFEHECELECRLPRGKCQSCGHVYRVRPPWEGKSKHFTKEFEAFALVLAREMPVSKVADVMKETDTRVWRMVLAHVEAAREEVDFSQVDRLGVDEMNRARGQRYISVFADLADRRVLYATEGRDHTVWDRFAEDLRAHYGDPAQVDQISMDMSPAYIRGAQDTCADAEIVFDKYHVIAHANEAVNKVRRRELSMGGWEARTQLKKSRWLWMKNPENLSDKQRAQFDRIDRQNLCTAKAYQMRLTLQDIYTITDVHRAKKRFRAWCRWVRRVAKQYKELMFAAMVKCANMIEVHLPGILAHWKHRLTNGYMEGLNSVFSAVKRKARGYRSPRYQIAMLYFVAGQLRIPAS
jgi:transposase